jgi:hypothetical protein
MRNSLGQFVVGHKPLTHPKQITWSVNENGCWICTSHKAGKSGYPRTSFNGNKFVSWVMYKKYKGKIKKGLCVLHTCDNRLCINPSHLWLGTIRDNNIDMHDKGRANPSRGEKVWCSKLTERDIKKIRSSIKTNIFLGKVFGVCSSGISRIKNKKIWKHVA